jgi:hypothetical protein
MQSFRSPAKKKKARVLYYRFSIVVLKADWKDKRDRSSLSFLVTTHLHPFEQFNSNNCCVNGRTTCVCSRLFFSMAFYLVAAHPVQVFAHKYSRIHFVYLFRFASYFNGTKWKRSGIKCGFAGVADAYLCTRVDTGGT